MESQAVAAASVVPFHCIICFDEFNMTDRPPVILPCGHTYLCEPCSKRIKCCMECRTPLFWTPPPMPRPNPPNAYRNNNARYGSRYQPPQAAPVSPVKHPEPIPLPMPKNVVLLAMMEASERQAMMAASVLDESAIDDDTSEQGDEGDAEMKRIIAGVESLSGPCGTYAVREEEGLAVLHHDPRRKNHEHVRDPADTREPFMIVKGQTVQVVGIQDDVFTLARGTGFIVASESQLVKVGGPIEKSCQLEGALDMVELHKKQLQRQLEEVERVSESLKASIDEVQGEEPAHPVITMLPALTTAESLDQTQESVGSSPSTPTKTEQERVFSSPHSPLVTATASLGGESVEVTEHTPGSLVRQGMSPALQGSPCTIDNADIASRYNRFVSGEANLAAMYEASENDHPDYVEFGCSSFFGKRYESDDEHCMGRLIGLSFDSDNSDNTGNLRPPTLTSTPSPGVASPRPISSTPRPSSSFDTVDFRTGMSGHRALLSTRTADPRSIPPSRGKIRMMSEHSGIGKLRGSNRLNVPSLGRTDSKSFHGK